MEVDGAYSIQRPAFLFLSKLDYARYKLNTHTRARMQDISENLNIIVHSYHILRTK